MIRNHITNGRALSMPAGLATGLCIALATTLILSALLAKLVSADKVEWGSIGYGIMIILLLTSVIDSKATCFMIKRRKPIGCLLAGLLYWLSLIMITALFFGGQYDGMGVTGVIVFCGSAIVCLLESRGEKGKKANTRISVSRKRL